MRHPQGLLPALAATVLSTALILPAGIAGAQQAGSDAARPFAYSAGYDAALRQAQMEPQGMPAQDVLEQVFFEFDSAELTAEARTKIRDLARMVEEGGTIDSVNVIGHADTAGPADYNLALSKRRAEAVSRELTSLGLSNQVIDLGWQGESEPLVETGDGVPLQENRRVSITIPAGDGFRAASAR